MICTYDHRSYQVNYSNSKKKKKSAKKPKFSGKVWRALMLPIPQRKKGGEKKKTGEKRRLERQTSRRREREKSWKELEAKREREVNDVEKLKISL